MRKLVWVVGVGCGLVAGGAAAATLRTTAVVAEDAFGAAEKGLSNPDPAERVRALALLDGMKRDGRAERVAVKALKDDDWGVQIKACSVLAQVGGLDANDPLVNVAVNGDIQWIRDAAVTALRAIDPERAMTPLLDAAGRATREEKQRVQAIDAAGAMIQRSGFTRLAAYAKSKEVLVAAAGVRAVGRLGGEADLRKELMDVLDTALDRRADKKFYFAYVAAIEALGRIDSPEARARLVSELIALPDDDLHAQERIARALDPQDDAAVAEAFRTGLKNAKKPEELRRLARLAARITLKPVRAELEALLANGDERVRSETLRAIGRIGDPASAPVVLPLLAEQKGVYAPIEVVTALARTMPLTDYLALAPKMLTNASEIARLQYVVEIADLGKPGGIEALKPFLADKSWRVASAAAATIGTLGLGEDLPLLEPLTKDKNWKIRAAALEGMGRLRTTKAVPFLIEGLSDRDPVARGVSLANLKILSGEKEIRGAEAWRDWYAKKGVSLNLIKKSRRADSEKALDKPPDRYGRKTPEFGVEVLQKAQLLVVSGAWDKVEKVLAHLDVKHTLMRAQELKEQGLNPSQIVLVNCEGNMDRESTERVQWFVNVGGYLMTTDWALTKTIQIGFPGYAKQFSGSTTGNDVVVVEEGLAGHPYLDGIFDGVPALQWWLEVQAFPMTITWPERCDVIVDSAHMRQKYGSSPLACVFRWGLGKVQHSASHFYLQEEGMTQVSDPKARMIFAADNLGISLEQIRKLSKEGGFTGQLNEETMKKIAPDYSMFRLIVNVVREKSDWIENL